MPEKASHVRSRLHTRPVEIYHLMALHKSNGKLVSRVWNRCGCIHYIRSSKRRWGCCWILRILTNGETLPRFLHNTHTHARTHARTHTHTHTHTHIRTAVRACTHAHTQTETERAQQNKPDKFYFPRTKMLAHRLDNIVAFTRIRFQKTESGTEWDRWTERQKARHRQTCVRQIRPLANLNGI